MKGQSAIEYLMSYGWMLLIVAVVGGAIYSTVGQRCVTSTTGFSSSEVQIEDFGTTSSGELRFNLRNEDAKPVEITNISVISDSGETASSQDLARISALDTGTAALSDVFFQDVNACNTIEVEITYDGGNIDNQKTIGQFTSTIKMGASSPPSQPTDISFN
jgi:hypothetical protein